MGRKKSPQPERAETPKFEVYTRQEIVFGVPSYTYGVRQMSPHVLTVDEAEEFARQLREAAAKVRQGA